MHASIVSLYKQNCSECITYRLMLEINNASLSWTLSVTNQWPNMPFVFVVITFQFNSSLNFFLTYFHFPASIYLTLVQNVLFFHNTLLFFISVVKLFPSITSFTHCFLPIHEHSEFNSFIGMSVIKGAGAYVELSFLRKRQRAPALYTHVSF